MKSLHELGEDALIQRLIKLIPRDPSPAASPGDDCAVVDPGPHSPTLQLLKTDALVCQIHFLPGAPARQVGWKSVARVLSDFAAMGGRPEHFLITLALPAETPVSWIEDVYRGIGDCLEKFGGFLAGGETTSVPAGSAAVISIAATGRVARDHLVLRSTGRTGDLIFTTGELGGSLNGKHLDFTPRLAEAAWLASNAIPTAMMDLSDGLAKDLPRLAAASGCGYEITPESLPITPGCTAEQALGDGEDFELLIAVPPESAAHLIASWPFEIALTQIGRLVPAGTGQSHPGGWEHFR